MTEKAKTIEELQAQVRRLRDAQQERQRANGRPTPPPDWSGSNPGNPYAHSGRGRQYGNHRE